jgi:hypothetical protein
LVEEKRSKSGQGTTDTQQTETKAKKKHQFGADTLRCAVTQNTDMPLDLVSLDLHPPICSMPLDAKEAG